MISQQTIRVVKSTAPLLSRHGVTLTRVFYERMFAQNPEVRPFFNPSHQMTGRQQHALAGAITAFAEKIDDLDALSGAIEVIAHKHASLMVKPEHYPIVGTNLLAAIREVMGESATDEVMTAWEEAYGFLAGLLSGREAEIYEETRSVAHGWEGFKKFRVTKRVEESSIVSSFYLVPSDGTPPPKFLPGQYLTVRVPHPLTGTTMRNYSLSDRPDTGHLRISVMRDGGQDKADPEGYVSHFLHDRVRPGDEIEVGPPCGEFTLDLETGGGEPLIFIAAGVGVTPLLSMLLSALEHEPERDILFIHACRNNVVQPFGAVLERLVADHPNLRVHYRYSEMMRDRAARITRASVGFVDGPYLADRLEDLEGTFYFCGPTPFMVATYALLKEWRIADERIRFEFFGPREELEAVREAHASSNRGREAIVW